MIYKLKVKRPLQLLDVLLTHLPSCSLISFEGNLKNILVPEHLHSEIEQGLLKRSTQTPKQDFWIFKLNEQTKNYLKNDFLNRIGIKSNVLHILIEYNGAIVFSAFDCFDLDSVILTQTNSFNDEFVQALYDKNLIGSL